MKIIALRGIGNRGKTTTIIHLHDQLMPPNGFIEIPGHRINRADIANILIKNNSRVGLTSSGDSDDALRPRLTHFQDNGCDIVVCACRSRGATNDILSQFSNDVYFIEKTVATSPAQEVICNNQDAQTLLDEVNKHL